jgi:hypothetical protein
LTRTDSIGTEVLAKERFEVQVARCEVKRAPRTGVLVVDPTRACQDSPKSPLYRQLPAGAVLVQCILNNPPTRSQQYKRRQGCRRYTVVPPASSWRFYFRTPECQERRQGCRRYFISSGRPPPMASY